MEALYEARRVYVEALDCKIGVQKFADTVNQKLSEATRAVNAAKAHYDKTAADFLSAAIFQ